MINRSLVLFIFLTIFLGQSHAQKIDTINSIRTTALQVTTASNTYGLIAIPPSPDAASLGKYGEIPVELSKGIPSINLPIYEIASGSLRLPISLSYHASGVKVNDMSSSVGLSWTLNAGGAITRSINGFPDENSGGYRNSFPPLQTSGNPYMCYIARVAGGEIDGQSDSYFYNFNGNSGKFMYANKHRTPSDQNLSAIVPVTIPYKPFKIDQNTNVYTITDADGTIYSFGKVVNDTISIETTYADSYQYTSTWYLTHIVSANRLDTIKISYTAGTEIVALPPIFSKTLLKTVSSTGQTSYSYQFARMYNPVKAIYPSSIYFKNGKVSFAYASDRQDITGAKRLRNILVYAKNSSGQYGMIKQFELSQTYFNCTDGYTQSEMNGGVTHTNSTMLKKMRLNSIVEKTPAGLPLPAHQFSYFEGIPLPIFGSYSQDFWGYYNGANNSKLLIWDTNGTAEPSATYGANRQPNFNYTVAGTLKEIIYPTGGKTVFEFEEPALINGTKGGGLRIKSLTNYEGSTVLSKKNFSYPVGYLTNTILAGNLSSLAYPFSVRTEDAATDCSSPTTISTVTSFSENYNCMLGSGSGSAIAYGTVEESQVDVLGNQLGKKVSEFRQMTDYTSSLYPYSPITYEWLRGQLLEEKLYNSSNLLLKRISNRYTVAYTDSVVRGYGVQVTYQPNTCTAAPSYCADGNGLASTNHQWRADNLDYLIGTVFLDSTMTYTYDESGNNLIFEKSEFVYAKATHHQLKTQRFTNSKNQVEETNFKYPHDLASSNVDYQEMVSRHIYSPILEKENKVNGAFISLDKTNYQKWYSTTNYGGLQGFFAPFSIQKQQVGGSLVNQIVFGEKLLTPTENGYDNKAHPIVYTELNGTTTRLTWWSVTGKQDQFQSSQVNGLFTTNYDYIPLIGIKSITNQDGKMVFYEYDGWNRLSKIHNDSESGPVIKSFCYNFAGQNVSCDAISAISGVTSLPTLTLLPDETAPMPVTLIEFTAYKQENAALLNWKTSEEVNSAYFIIERSLEGKRWYKIGNIDAKGASTAVTVYSYRDVKPNGGQNFYRLKMVDRDGTFSYSRMQSVMFDTGIALYPNPLGPADKLLFKGILPEKILRLTIYNQQGKIIYAGKPTSDRIETGGLSSGSYLAQFTLSDGTTSTLRFIKK